MRTKISGPRKRRTRQHVIADRAVHHVEGFIIDEGHTAERFVYDYGYDLAVYTYDAQGYLEPGSVCVQVKATEALQTLDGEIPFDLDVRDVNLWMLERTPVIFVLFDARERRGYWLEIQRYFQVNAPRRSEGNAKTVRVRIPISQRWNRRTVASLRRRKMENYQNVRELKYEKD